MSTKELIKSTALRLFVEQGIKETTIRDIATAADIAEGTLYRHYVSKDALAWDLFIGNFEGFAHALEAVQAAEATVRDKVAAMARWFAEAFERDPVLFRYLLLNQHAQVRKVTPNMANPINVLRSVVSGGVERGEIPKADPELLTAQILGMVLQTATFRVYGRLTAPLTAYADSLAEACKRVLG